ncbi:MAG TPA: hypothetical protein VHP58_00765 [Alphaproteobacteria bacterium]|nr:hypothetical protein [Alphaproteobacteria bacterium]
MTFDDDDRPRKPRPILSNSMWCRFIFLAVLVTVIAVAFGIRPAPNSWFMWVVNLFS